MQRKPNCISVIVTTYNWPKALALVLQSLTKQKTFIPYEIIIADDGSKEDTAVLIDKWKKISPCKIYHIWQEDNGFRAARIKNKALAVAQGDYIIFLDGDCVPRVDFIQNQYELAERSYCCVGHRILLNQDFSERVLEEQANIYEWNNWQWALKFLTKNTNTILPYTNLPIYRYFNKFKWQGAKGCNLAVWYDDLIKVNGWDEKFIGWGYEDSDLIIRLMRSEIKRKSGKFKTTVAHLWHMQHSRAKEKQNLEMLRNVEQSSTIMARAGLDRYI